MKNESNLMAIKIRNLTKSYGSVQALNGVNLAVERGEIFGFLGPNGAGKTTTIRCLLDLIRPDGGTIELLGFDPQVDPVAAQTATGYLPGELHLEDNYNAGRQLRLLASLRNGRVDWRFVEHLAKQLELDLERTIKNLSKGNKQKIGVIQALMHRPELLLLDEPTSGLDPIMQKRVLALVKEANEDGATVFFSSHVMSEVEALAGRVAIIREGRTVEVADTTALTARALHRAHIRFAKPVIIDPFFSLHNVTAQDPGSPPKGKVVEATLQIWGDMEAFIKLLGSYPVRELETVRPTLEEAFLAYYEPSSERQDGDESDFDRRSGNGQKILTENERAYEPTVKEVI